MTPADLKSWRTERRPNKEREMGMFPQTQKLGPARYVVSAGTDAVHVWFDAGTKAWAAQPQATTERRLNKELFDTYQDAADWAHDWLAEHS